MWFPCGVFHSVQLHAALPLVKTTAAAFLRCLQKYIYSEKNANGGFWTGRAACSHLSGPGESTGVSVSQLPGPNQHQSAQTDGCLFSRTAESMEELRHPELFLFLPLSLSFSHIYLKPRLERTIFGNVFPPLHLSPHTFFLIPFISRPFFYSLDTHTPP